MRLCLYVRKKLYLCNVILKQLENMKELLQHFREQPKEAIKEVAMCLAIFVVCGAMLFLSAILQGCSVQRESASSGKAVIITTDTTYIYHGGTVKFPKSK